jgi:peptide/nickel transport system substrate-binding protein
MKKNPVIPYISLIFALAGCVGKGGNDASKVNIQTNHVFVNIPDSKQVMADWSTENILVCHWLSDPANLHPASMTFQNARLIVGLTHSFLVVTDQQKPGVVVPSCVKSMPEVSPDGLQYTYELVDEATWDDGTSITSDDVVFTFKAYKNPLTDNPAFKAQLSSIKNIVADPSKPGRFTVLFKRNYVQSISLFTDFPLLSRHFFDPQNLLGAYTIEQMDDSSLHAEQVPALREWAASFNDGKYGNDPAFLYGSGPYKVVSWEHGQTITLQRKPNHWTQKLKGGNIYLASYPEKIIFKVIKDENAISLECKSQTIDASTWLTTKMLVDLQQDSIFNRNYNSVFMESYNINTIALNMRPDGVRHKKIFTDPAVRRAFALLTPIDRMMDVIVYGKATRWPTIVSPLKPAFNADLKILPYDVAEASRLLDEAGWKDTDGDNIRDKMIDGEKVKLEVELLYGATVAATKDLAAMIAEGAYPAGVRIIVQPVEGAVSRQKAADHDFDMVLTSWATNSYPDDYSQIWKTSSWVNKGSNYSGFGNAATDALIDSINATTDEAQRIPMEKRFQKVLYDEQPLIFLYSTYRKIIIHKRFGNALFTAESPGLVLNNLHLIQGGTVAMADDVHH